MEKVVCLVSGGIDSPVACALAAKSFEVIPLHFCLYPYTCEENFYTAINILRELRKTISFEKALVFPWPRILRKILKNCGKLACVVCRRGMLRVAEFLCEWEGALGIVTGESLGQKASQTLQNLFAASSGVEYPVIRPLLSLDKVEIERLSKEMGLWHEVHAGCCYATPRHPRTKARPETIDALELQLDLKGMISKESKGLLELRTFDEDLEDFLRACAT
jgi:thiamine biosynthesis protein ThiI